MITLTTLQITPEVLNLVAVIDEFKGALKRLLRTASVLSVM